MSPALSPQAQERLRWLRCWQALRKQGLSSTQASHPDSLHRDFPALPFTAGRSGSSRKAPADWRSGAGGLNVSAGPPGAQRVLRLREEYPRWGKDPDRSGVILLRRERVPVSTSMVGRILKDLKARGVLKEPPRSRVGVRRQPRVCPYAMRKPQDYLPQKPGDLVEVDTLDLRPLSGVVLKHFTARDVISRWDVVEAYPRATAQTASQFLGVLLKRMPFPLKAIQVDGGSEFASAFETACQERGIRLFVLPPRSPKLNPDVSGWRGPTAPLPRSSMRSMMEIGR